MPAPIKRQNWPDPLAKTRPEPPPARPLRTCDKLAIDYGADVLRIIGRDEIHALVLFRKLRDVRPEFPDNVFNFYDMMGVIRAGGKVTGFAEKSEKDGIKTTRIFYRLT